MRNLSTPLSATFGEDNPKKPKNYNYKAAEAKYLDEYPSATGRVTPGVAKELEGSFADKRKEWSKAYNKGEMSKGALRDSIKSTLADPRNVKDFMPGKGGTNKPRKKQPVWIGNESNVIFHI